jgi:hypothetical protein
MTSHSSLAMMFASGWAPVLTRFTGGTTRLFGVLLAALESCSVTYLLWHVSLLPYCPAQLCSHN